jgi:hypothetical protein
MEKTKCLLCDYPAQRAGFKSDSEPHEFSGGYKYICPECGLYAFGDVHRWIEKYGTDERKKKLSEYIKNNPDEEGNYKELTRTDVEKILNAKIPPIKWI